MVKQCGPGLTGGRYSSFAAQLSLSLVVASSDHEGPRRTTKLLVERYVYNTDPHSPTQPTPVGFNSKSCGQLHR